MKTTFKNIVRFAVGIAVIAALTSFRPLPSPSNRTEITLSGVPQMLIADGQETHGDKGNPPKGKG